MFFLWTRWQKHAASGKRGERLGCLCMINQTFPALTRERCSQCRRFEYQVSEVSLTEAHINNSSTSLQDFPPGSSVVLDQTYPMRVFPLL